MWITVEKRAALLARLAPAPDAMISVKAQIPDAHRFLPVLRLPLMLHLLIALVMLSLLGAAHGETALNALKAIPPEAAQNLARIEGRDGVPSPERWHILVHDPAAAAGLREYVVAEGKLVTSREISQFAEQLAPADVIGSAAVKVDSDAAAELASAYAKANGAKAATMTYQLKKESTEAIPVWKVTGLDASGAVLGSLMVTAGQGNVLSHEGFAKQPSSTKEKKTAVKKESPAPETAEEENTTARLEPKKQPEKKDRDPEERAAREKKVRGSNQAKAREKKESGASERRTASRSQERPRSAEPAETGVQVRRAEPVADAPVEEPRRRSTVGRVTDTMRKLLPF
jgi:hypothetical protein